MTPSSADISQQLVQPSQANATIPGHVPPTVAQGKAQFRFKLPDNLTLRMQLVFKIRNLGAFQTCLNAINDPTSPYYHDFLNATTLEPYLPTPGQKQSVVSFLQAHGFNVTDGPSPLVIKIGANASTVSRGWGIRLGIYGTTGAAGFYAPSSDPKFPQNLAGLVNGIIGLDNYTVAKPVESPCSGPYCPQGVQVGYTFSSLYSSGFNGVGQTVAIVDAPGDPNIQTAINTYSTQYNLPQVTLTIVYPDGTPTSWNPSWASEAAMDVEAVHAVAPAANIVVLYDTGDLMNSIDYVATHSLASIVSNSWTYVCVTGPCTDTQLPSAAVSSYDSRLSVDAALGLTILFASGDQGAKPDGTHLGTEFPASDPNVLAIGATNLVLTGCGASTCSGYGSESGASISGGGYSGFFPEPSWQTSAIGTKTGRAVPDVSMLGYSPNFWVYSTLSDKCGLSTPAAGWFYCAGTSLSTPLWAGFFAVTLQVSGGGHFGNVGPKLYSVASSSAYSTDFHDITSGSNNGYSAASGWDPVTGWGSPIANNLAYAFIPPSTISLQVNPNSVSLGSSVALSGAIAPSQPDGTPVNLSYSLDGTNWVTFMTVSLAAGSYSTAWTPPYPQNYMLRASWAGNAQYTGATSSTVTLTVTGTVTPNIALAINVPSSLIQGQIAPIAVTAFNPTGTAVTAAITIQIIGPSNYIYFDIVKLNVASSQKVTVYYDWTVPSQPGAYTITVGLLPPRTGSIDIVTVQVS